MKAILFLKLNKQTQDGDCDRRGGEGCEEEGKGEGGGERKGKKRYRWNVDICLSTLIWN